MLSVKEGGIKYHFKSLWYESTWVELRSLGPLASERAGGDIYITAPDDWAVRDEHNKDNDINSAYFSWGASSGAKQWT